MYKVITLCGSTRFKDEFLEAQKSLTLEGNIVIGVGLFGHSGDNEVWTEGTKEMLDDMHKRKIDMADEIITGSLFIVVKVRKHAFGDERMEKETKLRALCILKILYELTDVDHQLSTAEIAEQLEEKYGLKVYRTTINSDIEQLRQFGIDICINKSTQNRYFIDGRLFDVPELKLLIDAVESSKFITKKKSKELVEKLGTLASKNSSTDLKRNLCIEGRLKSVNEQIYYIVDALNDAINQGKKVSFQYFQYNVKKEQKLRHDGEVYVFSPYTLVWNGDYYYVIGYSDKHQDIGSFRVDRIYKQPKIMKEDAIPRPEDFDEAEYVKTMFHMYSTKPQMVELICDNDVMDTIIDKFGEAVKTYAYSLSSFKAEVEVATSHVFYSWVFGFGGRVIIKGPESVKREYAEMVKAAVAGL